MKNIDKELANLNKHEIVAITAFQELRDRADNLERNRKLKAVLLKLGYLVGKTREDGDVFLVVNYHDDLDFYDNMICIAEYFDFAPFYYWKDHTSYYVCDERSTLLSVFPYNIDNLQDITFNSFDVMSYGVYGMWAMHLLANRTMRDIFKSKK